MKRKIYLTLSILGFIIPNYFTLKVSIETGNILYWTKPAETLAGMFDNDISSGFVLDLLPAVLVFLVWSYWESKKLNIKNWSILVVLSLLFGIAGPFPLFLYWRELALERQQAGLAFEMSRN
jgi:hypothetical protein